MTKSALTAPMPPEAYWSPEWFVREREHVFFKNWIFAGLKQDVAQPNDYMSFAIAGVPVVVRNMKGKLVAFRNVCSHRHSVIHPAGCGNDMFRCPYHGWTYDAEGVPIGVPDNAKSFGFDKETKQKLALEKYLVEVCGNFVFVRLTAEGPSLREFLGPLATKLEHISDFLTTTYGKFSLPWNCNWKAGVEITLEGYHAPLVHPQSFSTHQGLALASDDFSEDSTSLGAVYGVEGIQYVKPHSTSEAPLSVESAHHLRTIGNRLKMPHSDDMTGFQHYHIYPNFMIAVNEGVNACIQLYVPVAADKMDAICWLTTGAPDKSLKGGMIWEAAIKKWRAWTEANWLEDQIACESVQRGVHWARHSAVLGHNEERLRYFQNLVLQEIGEKKVAA